MNGAALGVAVLAIMGGVGALAIVGGTGGMMGGGSMAACASMHPGASSGHVQCAQEARAGSHMSCDPMGMSASECREMESYMGGSGMTGPCH